MKQNPSKLPMLLLLFRKRAVKAKGIGSKKVYHVPFLFLLSFVVNVVGNTLREKVGNEFPVSQNLIFLSMNSAYIRGLSSLGAVYVIMPYPCSSWSHMLYLFLTLKSLYSKQKLIYITRFNIYAYSRNNLSKKNKRLKK